MLCDRVQLSSQGDWPEVDGVCLHRGNPLTYFCFCGVFFKLCLQAYVFAKMTAIFSDAFLIYSGTFVESQRSICKMQRHQSGRTVEPDQLLWLLHPNFCSSCQFT